MDEAAANRRAGLAPGLAAGVDEAMISRLVHAFYAKVRRDPQLGPIFDREVEDWAEHLARLCDFWSSVLLMSGRFKGQPMQVHAQLAEITPAHFARWLELFHEMARETCPAEAAALFCAKADNIGESLQLGIAVSRGESLPPLRPR
ncbi:MAG: group III truncated hemoglobin [Solirubrobacterales bacterium]